MAKRLLFTLMLLAFFVEVIEPSDVFVRATPGKNQDEIKKADLDNRLAIAHKIKNSKRPNESKRNIAAAAISSHFSGSAETFVVYPPSGMVSFVSFKVSKPEDRNLAVWDRPPISV